MYSGVKKHEWLISTLPLSIDIGITVLFSIYFFPVQLEGGQFQENSQEYSQYKQWRDSVAAELKQSVRRKRNTLLERLTIAQFAHDFVSRVFLEYFTF